MSDEKTVPPKNRQGWVTIAAIVLFGLFYAYDVWEALGNLLTLPQFYLDQSDVPWWLLVTNLLVPAVVFGVALWLGWKRPLLAKVVLFAVGLAIVAVLTLDAISLVRFV